MTDELCASSIKSYSNCIKHFFSVAGRKSLLDLTNADFDRFILRMKQRGTSNSRIANVISAVKWVLTRLQQRGLAAGVNLSLIKKPRISKKETNYLTETEIERFLDCIKSDIRRRPTVKNLRLLALTVLLLQTGARIGEVLGINMSDIDRHNKEIHIVGKGRKPRTLFLREETLRRIDEYLAARRDDEKALFATQNGQSRWSQTDVGRSFRKYKRLSGIKKDFVIHTFRHTFATHYLMKGVGINVVQTALGHSDPVTTLKYYAAAVEKTKVKEMINDRHFDFLPSSSLERAS